MIGAVSVLVWNRWPYCNEDAWHWAHGFQLKISRNRNETLIFNLKMKSSIDTAANKPRFSWNSSGSTSMRYGFLLWYGVIYGHGHRLRKAFGRNFTSLAQPLRLDCDSVLTLNVRGPSYHDLTRSISWLLMPWLLTSPGHQQPWYWLYWISRPWSYLRKDFKYLCHINVE